MKTLPAKENSSKFGEQTSRLHTNYRLCIEVVRGELLKSQNADWPFVLRNEHPRNTLFL